jgi:hypothetical protein
LAVARTSAFEVRGSYLDSLSTNPRGGVRL